MHTAARNCLVGLAAPVLRSSRRISTRWVGIRPLSGSLSLP
jgi:hypothetical protein